MTSKNSFWADIRENNKRRIWLWLVSWLFWFFYYPVGMLMLMSRTKTHNLIGELPPDEAGQRLLEAANEWLSFRGVLYVITVVAAVLIAIQGFSYLYKRQKVDFYHSVPVKKSRRFTVIYLNGVFIFFVPYAVSLLSAIAVAGMNGALDGKNGAAAVFSALLSVILFLGTYALAIVAVMMTGNLIITVFAAGIFMGYEMVVRALVIAYRMTFYRFYCGESVEEPLFLTAPVFQVLWYEAGEREIWSDHLERLLVGILLAVVYTGIAWFCYKKRPAEAAGKSMAFPKTKAVIKVLLVVPFALGTALLVMNLIGDMPYGMMVFGMVMAVVLGSGVIEVIYEIDIRAALRKKYQMLISGAAVAVIFLVYCFDLTGFDKWVPDPEKLEDTVVIFRDDKYRKSYYDENLDYTYAVYYFLSKDGIADTEAICALSGKKQEGGPIWCTMAYRMKNGKVVWREFAVDSGEEELLNRIMGSREYREAVCQLYDDAIYAKMKEEEVYSFGYQCFWEVPLEKEDMDEFREAYLKDRENADYSTFKNELICGEVSYRTQRDVEDEDGRMTTYIEFDYDIYPSYRNTLAFLEEKGAYDAGLIHADEVESVTVTNYHREMYDRLEEDGMPEDEVYLERREETYAVTKEFTQEDRIEELLQAVYPVSMDNRWNTEDTFSNDYSVSVRFKDSEKEGASQSDSRDGKRLELITGRIPSWLAQETAYQ